ncbi:F-box domain [Arabidopsis suecica]|uniref:F-box domain n=1 Tax=Arabidopsis suecica TaxID=45249 RepID=A0A8T2BA91_ARASU|nr:F-box domain [Arabidopsis suecica]
MAHEEKLPWELAEEILSRVPPNTLVPLRTVSKQWNALFDDKTFIKNHKATNRFILTTKSKIYSVSIDPKIEVCELTFDIPGLESQIPKYLFDCDKLLLCGMEKGVVVWNPCLRQSKWIEQDLNQTRMKAYGIGYNNKGSYKIVGTCHRKEHPTKVMWTILDFASNVWKDLLELKSCNSKEGKRPTLHTTSGVSLNGNLYWISFVGKINPVYEVTDFVHGLTKFNCSSEKFFRFCDLPCGMTNCYKDALVLKVIEGDRFSLLKQCHATKKIEVWVSKYKIDDNLDIEDVEWIKFMEVSSPNLPDLVDPRYSQPSYFIEDKRLVACSCDDTGRAWIYVFGENKLISKTQIDYVVDPWPSHSTFIPSLVPVPRGQREELAELQV